MKWHERHPAIQQEDFVVSRNAVLLSEELLRPCNIKKPKMFKDGEDQWCALLGDDIMSGVCGFGNSPEEACLEFDREWVSSLRQQAGERGGEQG